MSDAVAASAHERLARRLSVSGLAGIDPLESLISPLAAHLPRGLPEQLWLRAVMVSGKFGLGLARVPELRMVKTLALVVLAQRIHHSPHFDTAALAREIQQRRNLDGGWGYEFDAQFRWGRYSAGASNAVVTAFVVEGLPTGERDRSVLRYTKRDLWHPRGFFRYYAGSPVLIHNANALMCRAAARLGTPADVVRTALNPTLQSRTASGLWEYGDRSDLRWADTYHNAYIAWVLQDLARWGMIDEGLASEAADAWLHHFFTSSGAPKLHDTNRDATTNVNAVATALFWLCTMQNPPRPVDSLIDSTAKHLLLLQREDGSLGTEGPHYPRWNDAPGLVALAAYLRWLRTRQKANLLVD